MKNPFRLTCGVAAAAILAILPVAAAGQSSGMETGAGLTFYGQLNPAWVSVDDGVETYSNVVDSAHSNSRLGLTFDQQIHDIRMRVTLEAAIGFPQSSAFSQDGPDPVWEWEITDLRRAEVRFGGDFGEVHLGQGSMATDGSAEMDLSGTTLAGYASIADTAGAYRFRERGSDRLSGIAIADAFNDLDGSRRFRVRYDTPDLEGVSVAAAYGVNALDEEDDGIYYDLAVRYDDTVGEFTVGASVGHAWRTPEDGPTRTTWIGSLSLLHAPTGLNATVAGGGTEGGGSYGYAKLGWTASLFAVGTTSVSADRYVGSDFPAEGSASTAWGLQAVQRWDDVGLEGYAGYRSYAFDDGDSGGPDLRDIRSTMVGARWRF